MEEFARVFMQHAKMRTPPSGERWMRFWEALTVGNEKWYHTASAAVVMAAFWAARAKREVWLMAIGAAAFLCLGIALYAHYTPHYLLAGGILAGAVLIASVSPRTLLHRALTALWTALLLLTTLPWLAHEASHSEESPQRFAQWRAELDTNDRRPLLVDDVAARYVYRFQLPAGSLDWRIHRSDIPLGAKSPGERWLISARNMELYVRNSGVQAKRFSFAGRVVRSRVECPQELRYVP